MCLLIYTSKSIFVVEKKMLLPEWCLAVLCEEADCIGFFVFRSVYCWVGGGRICDSFFLIYLITHTGWASSSFIIKRTKKNDEKGSRIIIYAALYMF